MAWDFKNDRPVYIQICDRIRLDILNGVYKPDEQIPSVRIMALKVGVNPNTMQHAMTTLEEEKIFITRGTTGRFVTTDENVLEMARQKAKNSVMTEIAEKITDLGISAEELSTFLKNYETKERR